jgi:DDE_Tnp_1-associated
MITGQEDDQVSRTIPLTVNTQSKSHSRPKDPASIFEYVAALPDPRRDHGTIQMLDEIVFLGIGAVLCGAENGLEIADDSESKIDWLKTFLTLPGGIPSHDPFRRVFCLLDPLAVQSCFADWITALMNRHGLTPIPLASPELRPIAIAGKTQRGSARRTVGQSPLPMVSAWSVENHLTLGQVVTHAKSKEITAIPELLKLLDLEGAVVTIDALGCQQGLRTTFPCVF